MITGGNFLIITGHSRSTNDVGDAAILKMKELDTYLQSAYPENTLSINEVLNLDYDFLDTYVAADFVKPNLAAQVTIQFTDVSWVNDANKNSTGKIAIGTKEIYDLYQIDTVLGSDVTCTLIEENAFWVSGETIRHEYNLVSDLGRDEVMMELQVFSYDDIISFEAGEWPRSLTDGGGVHPVSYYEKIGTLIGRKIKLMTINS